MIRVLVADDHDLIRRSLTELLSAEPDIDVCGVAETGEAAAALVLSSAPDVVLLDLSMPGAGGIAAAAAIHLIAPDVRIMMVSAHDDVDHVRRALGAGASGYILKDAAAEELVDAVRAVHRGEVCLSPDAARVLAALSPDDVSERPSEPESARARPRSPWAPRPRP